MRAMIKNTRTRHRSRLFAACGVFVSSSLGDDANAGSKDKPVKAGCAGGSGGKGGSGGRGGGGTGGHAIGIASTGKAVPIAGVTFMKGTPGAGGTGDSTMSNLGDGAKGVGAEVQVFP